MAELRICTIEGCGKRAIARGWCSKHYKRWKKHGDPLTRKTVANGEAWLILEQMLAMETGDCVIWPLSKDTHGYGQINDTDKGRPVGVHRVICQKAHGEPPTPAHQAAHSCGRGHFGCCNKRHLRWATRVDNESDKDDHGTRLRGVLCWNAKLSEDDVRAIRGAKGRVHYEELAGRYGVSKSHINNIQARKSWAWLL